MPKMNCRCGQEHSIQCADADRMAEKGITELPKCSFCRGGGKSKKEQSREEKYISKEFNGEGAEVKK